MNAIVSSIIAVHVEVYVRSVEESLRHGIILMFAKQALQKFYNHLVSLRQRNCGRSACSRARYEGCVVDPAFLNIFVLKLDTALVDSL